MSPARFLLRATVAGVAALAIALNAQPVAAQAAVPTATTEIIVSLEPGANVSEIAEAAGALSRRSVPLRPDLAVLRVPALMAPAIEGLLDANPDVGFAEPNGVARMAAATNDTMLQLQWHMLERAKAAGSANWVPVGGTTLGAGAKVAVLDTGVTAHADLDGVLAGRDFIDNDEDPSDPHGHGTHVAGTVAGTAGNGIGVVGVAPGAEILPVRVLDAAGNAPYDKIFAGMQYAVDQGADILNMSLAGTTDAGMCSAVSKAVAAGVVVIAATGNTASAVGYPAACSDAIAVGAVTMSVTLAPYSNTGPEVDLTAPGGEPEDRNGDGQPDGVLQYSAFDQDGAGPLGPAPGYYYSSGTSMATPHAAGAAAIVLSMRSWAGPKEVRTALTSSATDKGETGKDYRFGSGLLDVAGVVSAASALPASAPATTVTTEQQTTTTTAQQTTTTTAPPKTTTTTASPTTSSTTTSTTAPGQTQTTTSTTAPTTTTTPRETTSGGPSDSGSARVERLSGPDRFSTAAAVSADRFSGGSAHVWLATGASYADALSTGAAAGRQGGPLLLVEGCGMPGPTASELSRLDPTAITVVGGPAAVCQGVLDHAQSLTGVQPSRIAGSDRFDTAAALSRTFWSGGASTVVLASAGGFADSLGGGPLGAEEDGPLLLAASCDLPAATADELSRLRPTRVLVMGGPGAVCEAVLDRVRSQTGATVTRLSGADRYSTATAASALGWRGDSVTLFIASGQGFADGLSAGVAAAGDGAPLLLVPACGTLPAEVRDEIQRLGSSEVFAVGGPAAICADMLDQIEAAL